MPLCQPFLRLILIQVSTAQARAVLPKEHTMKDVVSKFLVTQGFNRVLKLEKVFNFQRIPLLTIALGESPPNPADIYQAMQDRVKYHPVKLRKLSNS